MNKRAFTFVGALLVLVIIGVVASIAIPSLINSQQDSTLSKAQKSVIKTQKFDNQLNQAISLSQVENGHISTWSLDGDIETFLKTYLKPYLRISKDCGVGQSCWAEDEYVKNGGNSIFINNKRGIYKAILNDGTFFAAYITATPDGKRSVHIHADTNGAELPNTKGEDISEFIISNNPSSAGLYVYSVTGEDNVNSILEQAKKNY